MYVQKHAHTDAYLAYNIDRVCVCVLNTCVVVVVVVVNFIVAGTIKKTGWLLEKERKNITGCNTTEKTIMPKIQNR